MKVLITSDIHIYDYPQYNQDGFRLTQFERLAHRINEIAEEQGCEMLIIAGDIIHKPVLRPYIVYAANQFMSILGGKFGENIRFILGQHDLDTKSTTHYNTDSIVPIISRYGKYMHNNSELIGGVLFGFHDWTPDQDWTQIKGINRDGKTPVDVMIGHLTLDERYGQEYDSDFYKVGIFGDIHQPREFDNGKTWTVNVPIPHYISDCQTGSVIVLDTSDLSVQRVPTESDNFKYLKIFYEDDPEAVDYVDGNYPYLRLVERPKFVTSAESFHKSIDVKEVINEVIKQEGLEDIHSEINKLIDIGDCSPLDFNFRLKWIEIHNFRSISHFRYDFVPGMTMLNGLNGSGKSSFLRAINFLFTGEETERKCCKSGESEFWVNGELEYQGRTHTINRYWCGGNSVEYIIDGKEVNAVGVRAINNYIREQLPFIDYISLIIRAQRDPGLLTSYGFKGRIDLISNLLGLNLINHYADVANSIKTVLKNKVKDKTIEISSLNKSLDFMKTMISDEVIDIDDLRDRLKLIDERLNTVSHQMSLKDQYIKLQVESDSLYGALESLVVNHNVQWTEQDQNDLDQLIIDVKDLDNKYKELLNIQSEYNSSVKTLKQLIKSKDIEINKLKSNLINVPTHCPTCGKPYDNVEEAKSHIINEISKVESDKSNLMDQLSQLTDPVSDQDFDAIQQSKSEKQQLIQSYKDKKYYHDLYMTTKDQHIESLNRLSKFIADNNYDPGKSDNLRQEFHDLSNQKSDLKASIKSAEDQIKMRDKYNSELDKLEECESELSRLTEKFDRTNTYYNLFTSNGAVTASVFSAVAEEMTDSNIIVRTVKELASGETRIDFDVDKKIGDIILPYSDLSGGQQTLVDVLFMYKLFKMSGRLGLLIFDETLKEIDSVTLDEVVTILKEMPVNSILISTHVESFPYYDSKITASLQGNTSNFIVE